MSDFDRITEAITYLTENAGHQPSLENVAAHLHLSPFHFQRLFCRWTGTTPKRFLQILTVERAKHLLARSSSVLATAGSVGLSSSSRLHDHFVSIEAVTPGEFKTGGVGLHIDHALHDSPFGKVFIAATNRGICRLAFVDDNTLDKELLSLQAAWPMATLTSNPNKTRVIVNTIFSYQHMPDRPLSLYVYGTNFQVSVWKALLKIPAGSVVSYTDVASAVGRPRAARAVGTALGANPAAFIIPCHRVIQQSGKLGGYHWGETRLQAIHAWESAWCEN